MGRNSFIHYAPSAPFVRHLEELERALLRHPAEGQDPVNTLPRSGT
ncbi:MAG: hypothetical protein AAF438_05290 [Pseudomonadota bacterium]